PTSVLVAAAPAAPPLQVDTLAVDSFSASIEELFRDVGSDISGNVNGPPLAP
ncbi:unnamed protein product, partial [Ilex paraguariensis]